MTFEAKRLGRQKARYDSANDDNPLVYQLTITGAKVTPTSATITLYEPGNTAALISAAAMTVSGTLLLYVLDTTTEATWPKKNGYRADVVITYSSTTYDRHFLFDVVPYLLDLGIGIDQLSAIDDAVTGTTYGGDESLARLVNAFRDTLQMRIESKVIADGKLIENMILDPSKVATAALYGILAQIGRSKGWDRDKVTDYQATYDNLFAAALGSIQYDPDQDGTEEEQQQGTIDIRLET